MCSDLLKRMMTVDPKQRITMSEILVHPWIKHGYVNTLKTNSIYSKDVVDDDVVKELAAYEDTTFDEMKEIVKQWKFDYITATYLLLLQRKERKESISLPSYRKPATNVVNSPTIHASLETGLDRRREEFDDDTPFTRSPMSLQGKRYNDKENIPQIAYATPKRATGLKQLPFVTPKR